ncbi:MAG TPA: peptidase domain-containing ABC transporter [Pyrinomonadaceae bacterium]|nr:peptidase domain-containing ABC transporter [Pyrinomonadaceae bacterium]
MRIILKRILAWPGWALMWAAVRALTGRLHKRRVPVMLQMSTGESGAACLAMVLSYFGRETRIAECHECTGTVRGDIMPEHLAQAARSFGLRVKSLAGLPADAKELKLPAVAHTRANHFVVVERVTPKRVHVVDPSVGRAALTPAEFRERYTEELLSLEPGMLFQRSRAPKLKSWRYYLAYLWRHYTVYVSHTRRLLLQIFGVWLILLVLGLALPLLTKILVDQVLGYNLTSLMPILGLGMVFVILTQIVTGYLRVSLMIYLQARIDTHMMPSFLEHLASLPFRFFQQRTHGDLLMRGGLVQRIRELLTVHLLSIVLYGTLVLGYLLFLLVQDLSFGLLVLGLGLAQLLLLYGTMRRVNDLSQSDVAAQTETQGYLVEALSGMETLKASGTEDRALHWWGKFFMSSVNISLRRHHLTALVEALMGALRSFSPLILLWVGAYKVLDGSFTLGSMLAQNSIALTFLQWLGTVVQSGQQLQQAPALIDRVTDILEAEPEQDLRAVRPAHRLTGHVEVRNVSFRYDQNSPYVLRDVSFTVRPGEKVAVVGRTGSGKSTLIKLMLAVFRQNEGEILYDGVPLQQLDYTTLRRQCGVVLQETFLFKDSMRQNISFNDPSLGFDRVVEAARLACIHDDIMQMPLEYETPAVEGGSALSGGQRQRVSLARALACRPTILFLDEATSHLDVETERRVNENLNGLSCTRVVVAHRLSTVQNADQILVVDEGTIVERGTHEELLAKGGFYASLVRSQTQPELLTAAV